MAAEIPKGGQAEQKWGLSVIYEKDGLQVVHNGTILYTNTGLKMACIADYNLLDCVLPEACAFKLDEKDKGFPLGCFMKRLEPGGMSFLPAIFAAPMTADRHADYAMTKIAKQDKTEWTCVVGWTAAMPPMRYDKKKGICWIPPLYLPRYDHDRRVCWTACRAVLDPRDGKIAITSLESEPSLSITLSPPTCPDLCGILSHIYSTTQ